MRALGRARVPVAAFELGNEPDLYPRGRTFRVGPLVVHRPSTVRPGMGWRDYVAEARAYAEALPAGAPLSAGGFATKPWVHAALPLTLDALGGRLTEVTAHAYALTACNPTAPAGELRARLLDDATTAAMARGVEPYFRLARPRGLPVRVSEFNSAVCGGVRGVSDVMAAALWAPQALFALADAGVSQVDVHTWAGSLYAPFVFGAAKAQARPLDDALRLFARAAPAGSRLTHATHLENAGNVRAWTTVGAREPSASCSPTAAPATPARCASQAHRGATDG